LQLELPQILLNDIGHGHAQRGRKILGRHDLQPRLILQQSLKTVCQPLGISRGIEVDSDLFALRHLAEVG